MIKLNSIGAYSHVLDNYAVADDLTIYNTKTGKVMPYRDYCNSNVGMRLALQTIDGGVHSFSVNKFRKLVMNRFGGKVNG